MFIMNDFYVPASWYFDLMKYVNDVELITFSMRENAQHLF